MGMTKRWCKVCKFNQYDPHPCKTPSPVAEDDSLSRIGTAVKRRKSKPTLTMLVFNSEGLSGGSIPGEATVVLAAQPQCPFRPKRLVVPAEIGSNFSLSDLRIGNCSQFASYAGGGVSMSAFPPDPDPEKGYPIDNLDGMPTVMPGQCLTLFVKNRNYSALQFSALVYGETCYDDY